MNPISRTSHTLTTSKDYTPARIPSEHLKKVVAKHVKQGSDPAQNSTDFLSTTNKKRKFVPLTENGSSSCSEDGTEAVRKRFRSDRRVEFAGVPSRKIGKEIEDSVKLQALVQRWYRVHSKMDLRPIKNHFNPEEYETYLNDSQKEWEAILQKFPHHPLSLGFLGLIHMSKMHQVSKRGIDVYKESKIAIEFLTKSVKQDPTNLLNRRNLGEAYRRRGCLYSNIGRFRYLNLAKHHLEKVYKSEIEDYYTLVGLGEVCLDLIPLSWKKHNLLKIAKDCFEKIITHNPNDARVLLLGIRVNVEESFYEQEEGKVKALIDQAEEWMNKRNKITEDKAYYHITFGLILLAHASLYVGSRKESYIEMGHENIRQGFELNPRDQFLKATFDKECSNCSYCLAKKQRNLASKTAIS